MSFATPKGKDRGGQNIQVFARVRPLNEDERCKGPKGASVVDTPRASPHEILVKERNAQGCKKYVFDRVFGPDSRQKDVYNSVVKPLVEQVLEGYNCTVFAYGQTGSGKTFTMEGTGVGDAFQSPDSDAGVIPRALNQLFDELTMLKSRDERNKTSFDVKVSFLELYNEEIFDLLSAKNDTTALQLYDAPGKKGSVVVRNLQELPVTNKSKVHAILQRGSEKRQTAATLMNAHSSRSHTVFTVTAFVRTITIEGEDVVRTGKLNLVDLAGAENIKRSGAKDGRAKEAGNINKSLLALGTVIRELTTQNGAYVSYRNSKLTRLLQDSLGGKTKTSIIATVSPSQLNVEETKSTLDYASEARNIKNQPEVNQKITTDQFNLHYAEENARLRELLSAQCDKEGIYLPHGAYEEMKEDLASKSKEIAAIIEERQVLEEETAEMKKMLERTEEQLKQTELERDEQKYLTERHIEDKEEKLIPQLHEFSHKAAEAEQDLSGMHDKVERKQAVEDSNLKVVRTFAYRDEELSAKNMDFLDRGLETFGAQMSDNWKTMLDECFAFTQEVLVMKKKLNDEKEEKSEKIAIERQNRFSEFFELITTMRQQMHDDEKAMGEATEEKVKEAEKEEQRLQDKERENLEAKQAMQKDQFDAIIATEDKCHQKIIELTQEVDRVREETAKKKKEMEDKKANLRNERGKVEKMAEECQKLIKIENEIFWKEFEEKRKAFEKKQEEKWKELDGYMSKINHLKEKEENLELERSELESVERSTLSESNTTIVMTSDSCREEVVSKCGSEFPSALKELNDCNEIVKTQRMEVQGKIRAHLLDHVRKTIKRTEEDLEETEEKVEELQKFQTDNEQNRKVILEEAAEAERLQDETTQAKKNEVTRTNMDRIEADMSALESLRSSTKSADNARRKLRDRLLSDHKADVPTGVTPKRVSRQYPTVMDAFTPDPERICRFQRTLRPVLMEEDDDDSVISQSRTGSARQSVESMPESSIGYASDRENVEPEVENFIKPRSRPESKLKIPSTRSRSNSQTRSGSKTRPVLGSLNN